MIELVIYLCAALVIITVPVVLTLLQLVILMMESTQEPETIVRCDGGGRA